MAAILFRDLFVELPPERIAILRDVCFYEGAIEKWPEQRSKWVRDLRVLRLFAHYGLSSPREQALLELLERHFGHIEPTTAAEDQ